MSPVFNARHHLLLGCLVAAQFVRDHHTRDVLATLEQLTEKLLGGSLVSPALHQDIQHVAFLVYGAPEVGRLPIDFQEYLVEKPFISWTRTTPAKLISIGLPKLP